MTKHGRQHVRIEDRISSLEEKARSLQNDLWAQEGLFDRKVRRKIDDCLDKLEALSEHLHVYFLPAAGWEVKEREKEQ